jgi:hypothetical protein
MTLAKAKAKTNETFIVQVSLTIVTDDRKNMFIVQATVVSQPRLGVKNAPTYFGWLSRLLLITSYYCL